MSRRKIEPLIKASKPSPSELTKPNQKAFNEDPSLATKIPNPITKEAGLFGPTLTEFKPINSIVVGELGNGKFKGYTTGSLPQLVAEYPGESVRFVLDPSFEFVFGRGGIAYTTKDAEGFVEPPHVGLRKVVLGAGDILFDRNEPKIIIEINHKSGGLHPGHETLQLVIAGLITLGYDVSKAIIEQLHESGGTKAYYRDDNGVLSEILSPIIEKYRKQFLKNNQSDKIYHYKSTSSKLSDAQSGIKNLSMGPTETPMKPSKRRFRNSDDSPIKKSARAETNADSSPSGSPVHSRSLRASFPGPKFNLPSFNLNLSESDVVESAELSPVKNGYNPIEKKLGRAPASFDPTPMTIKKSSAKNHYQKHVQALKEPPLFNLNINEKAVEEKEEAQSPSHFGKTARTSSSNFFEKKLGRAPATFDADAAPKNTPMKKNLHRNHLQALEEPLPFKLNLDVKAFDENDMEDEMEIDNFNSI